MTAMRAGLACLVTAVACACAPARIAFPAGPAVAAPDAPQFWSAATEACRGAQNFSAEIEVNGAIGAKKLRRVVLQGAMTRTGLIKLLAVAPAGPPIFTLAGRADEATLVLPRERRVLTAPAADIIDALIGVHLSPVDWLDLLSGCVATAPAADGARVGDATIVTLQNGAGRVRLQQDGASWRIVAGERPDVSVEYRDFQGRWPGTATLLSRPGAAVVVDLRMAIGQIFANATLDARLFVPSTAPDLTPMTLSELRAIGPLGSRRAGGAPSEDR